MLKIAEIGHVVPMQRYLMRNRTTVGATQNAQVSIVSSKQEFENIEADWRALERNCHVPPTVFQSFDWIKTWIDVHLSSPGLEQLFIVTGHRGSRLVFAMPLALSNNLGIRKLSWLTQPIGQYGDVLCDKSVDVTDWSEAALKFIREKNAADCLRLRHIRETSNIGPYAKAHWHDGKLNERAPAMDLTRFVNEAAYDARYDADQRRRRKRIRAKLEKFGDVCHEVLKPAAACESIDQALDEKLKWLGERGRHNQALHCAKHRAFLKAMAHLNSPCLKQITTRMSAGGKPVSWEVGFLYQGTQYQYLTSHMNDMTDLSPGRLAFDLSQRKALMDGIKKFDLMVPFDKHKESWASGSEPVTDFHFPLTARGAIYSGFYLGWARPMARKAYQNAPKPLLKLAQRILCL